MNPTNPFSASGLSIFEGIGALQHLASVLQAHVGNGRLLSKSQYDECASSLVRAMVNGERPASAAAAALEKKILQKVPPFSNATDARALAETVRNLAVTYFYFEVFGNWVASSEVSAVRRLEWLQKTPPLPTVAVFGTYNHGKSQLLNALADECETDQKEAHFKVSDARETVKAEPFEKHGIRWVDTPGLDADTGGEDDRRATEAVWQQADVHLFVHNIREGELSESERIALIKIDERAHQNGQPLFVILTKIDGQEQEDIDIKVRIIKERLPRERPVFLVSGQHYANGKRNNKPMLVERSGIEPLLSAICKAAEGVETARAAERMHLASEFSKRLKQGQALMHTHLDELKAQKAASLKNFQKELSQLQARMRFKLN